MPSYLRKQIDRAARERGLTRSGLIQAAAREYIERGANPRERLLDEIAAMRPDVQPPSAQKVNEWIASKRRGKR